MIAVQLRPAPLGLQLHFAVLFQITTATTPESPASPPIPRLVRQRFCLAAPLHYGELLAAPPLIPWKNVYVQMLSQQGLLMGIKLPSHIYDTKIRFHI